MFGKSLFPLIPPEFEYVVYEAVFFEVVKMASLDGVNEELKCLHRGWRI